VHALVPDDELMARAMHATGIKTKKEAVEQGLRTLLRLKAEQAGVAGRLVAGADELDRLAAQHKIEWIWVKGHAGHTENERADVLARRGVELARNGS